MGYFGHIIRHNTLQHRLLKGKIEGMRRGLSNNYVDMEYYRVGNKEEGRRPLITGGNSLHPTQQPDDDKDNHR